MSLRVIALAISALLGSLPTSAQEAGPVAYEEANRRDFAAGVAAMFAGHYDEAAGLFRELSRRTNAPRVKLELARSLFLAGHYREAKLIFNGIYYSAGLPYQVRRAINVYLERIDRKIGFIVPTFGLTVDSNPTRATSTMDYVLFGSPVVLNQRPHGRAIGVQYGLSGRMPLNASSSLSVVGAISGTKYPESPNSFASANAGVSFDDAQGKHTLETGVQYLRREHSDTLISPYLTGTYRLGGTKQSQTDVGVLASYSTFESNCYLNGPLTQISVQHGAEVQKQTTLVTAAHVSAIRTRDSRYNQLEGGLSASVYHSLASLGVDVIVKGQVGRRAFSGVDPLFGGIRRDTDYQGDIKLVRTSPIRRLFPSVGLRYERRDSTLPFYAYADFGITTDLFYRF